VTGQAPSEAEGRLLSLVPEDGAAVGNKWLRERLGWEAAHYFEVRDRLVERKVLLIGRGRGGSVYRVKPISPTKGPEEPTESTGARYRREKDLYNPVAEALRDGWSKTLRHHNYLVQITGAQGSRATGGMWTRPDVTVVAVDTYAYVPGKFLEVTTYEVKAAGSWGVEGVFEAASHSRFATKTYLLIHAPNGLESVPAEQLERLQAECARFGIGLGLFEDPTSYDTYDFVVDPARRVPDPAEMDRFISQQLSDVNKRHIVEWLR
jgi:hypothetical protein